MYELSNVSIVIVSFNSEEKLFELFPSIPESCELIIVNNALNSLPQELKKSKRVEAFKDFIISELSVGRNA